MDGSKDVALSKYQCLVEPSNLADDFKSLRDYLSFYAPTFIKPPLQSNTFSITKDKKNLILGEHSGRLTLCNRISKEIIQEKQINIGSLNALSISEDGKFIYIGTAEGRIYVYNFEHFDEESVIHTNNQGISHIITTGADTVIVSGFDGTVVEWQLSENTKHIFHRHEAKITAMDYSDGSLISASSNGSIFINETRESEPKKMPYQHSRNVTCVKVQGDHLVVAFEKLVHVYNKFTLKEDFVLSGHDENVLCMDISGDLLVTGSADSTLKLWSINEWNDETTLYGHSGAVLAVIMEDGIINSIGKDGNIRASRIPPLPQSKNFKSDSHVIDIIHNPKNNLTYAINSNHEIFELSSNRHLKKCPSRPIGWSFTNFHSVLVVFYRKSETSTHTEVSLINLDEGASCQEYHLLTSSVPTTCIATDGTKYLITGEMFRITIWNAVSGLQEYIFRSHNADITTMVTVGEYLFAGDASGCIKQYHLGQFVEVASYNEANQIPVTIIKISKDFKFLFSVNESNLLRI